jgi:hypothetical protein
MLLPTEGRLLDFGTGFCFEGLDLLFAFAYLRYASKIHVKQSANDGWGENRDKV